MKRGIVSIAFVFCVLFLLLGCQSQLVQQKAKSSMYSKLISVVKVAESSGGYPEDVADAVQEAISAFTEIGGVDIPDIPDPETAYGGVFIGNFQLTMNLHGQMQDWDVPYEGQTRRVRVYKLDSITVSLVPYPFMIDWVYYQNVGAGWATRELSRAKLSDIAFNKYIIQDKSLVRAVTDVSGPDTRNGNSVSKTITFSDTYVPADFTLTLRFDVGLASSSEDVPATYPAVQANLPYPVSWQPFPDEKSTDSQLSDLTGIVYGNVYDALSGAPVRNRELSFELSAGGPRPLITDPRGYYESLVHLEADRDGTVPPESYQLFFEGCKSRHDCKYSDVLNLHIENVFAKQYPTQFVPFDYGPGRIHYPSASDYFFVEGENNRLYWGLGWINDKVYNRERSNHDFLLQPAPPAAYLRANSPVKKGETVNFFGAGAATYSSLVRWSLNFGDGQSVEGSGALASATHVYPESGEYLASIVFCEAGGRCSPSYTQKIVVGKISPSAVIDSVSPSPLYLSLNENHSLLPGSVVVKAHGTQPEGQAIVAWELSSLQNFSGSGSSFEKTLSFNQTWTHDIKVRFKDNQGIWSDWAVHKLRILQGNVTGNLKANAQIEYNQYVESVENGIVAGTKVGFYGTGYSPAGNAIVNYKWDFDGNGIFDSVSASSGTVEYLYKTPGVYTAKFVVEDSKGNTAFQTFTIPVLDISVNFDMGGTNVVNEGDSITMSSTLFNNDQQKDVKVKLCSMIWYQYANGQYNFWHQETSFYNSCKGIGTVKAKNNKVLWKETETVCCPGKQKVVIQVETQFGIVETIFFKTVNHVDRVNLSSTQNSCNIPGTINLLVSSNMPNTNCNLELSLNNGQWVSSGGASTDNNGYVYFTPACTTPGNYRARAVCGSATSNIFSFAAVGQQQPGQQPGNETPQPPQPSTDYYGIVELRTNKPEYSQAKLFSGEEVILYLLSSSDLPTGARCDLYTRHASSNDWVKLGYIPTATGSGSFRLGGQGFRINAGSWLAKAICRNLHTSEVMYNVLGSFLPETAMPKPQVPEGMRVLPGQEKIASGDTSYQRARIGQRVGKSGLTLNAVADVDGSFFAAEALLLGIIGLVIIAAFFVFRK